MDKQLFILTDFVFGYNDYSCSVRYQYMICKNYRCPLVAIYKKLLFRYKQ